MPAATNHSGPSSSSNKRNAKALLDFWLSHSHLDPDNWLDPLHTTSNSTRRPQQFDLHLDKSLQLKHVEYSPDILRDLSDIALQSLKFRKDIPSLPDRCNNLIVDGEDFNGIQKSTSLIADEAGVAKVYEKLIGGPIAQIATMLELGVDSWDDSLLAWFPRCTPGGGRSAVADGFLRIHQPVFKSSTQNCSEDIRMLITLFSELAVWEFKNIFAGRYTVMKSIMLLSGEPDFEWQTCPKPCHDLDSRKLPLVNGARMGFDSENAQCSLNHVQAWTRSRVQEEEASDRVSRRILRSGSVKPVKRTAKATGKKSQVLKEHVEPNKTDQKHAKYIVQQAWAEATKHDCTFLIIHSGVYEIIGIRCRATQTLYLSDLIEPSRTGSFPPYGQLQIGLYIAIVRDAIDRAKHLSGKMDSCQPWSQEFSNTFTYEDEDEGALCAQSRKVKVNKVPAQDPWELLCIANNATQLLLQPNQKDQINAASFSGTYRRHRDSNLQPDSSGSLPYAPFMIKFSTPSLLSSVVDGILYVKPEKIPNLVEFQGMTNFSRSIVVKIAPTGRVSIRQLHSEFEVYQRMRRRFEGKMNPRIPEVIGFFIRDDEKRAVLVLERIGTDCGQDDGFKGETVKRTLVDSGSQLETRSVREAFKRHLNILHGSGLVHGSLSLQHLLCHTQHAGNHQTALISLRNVRLAHGVEIIAERQDFINLVAPFDALLRLGDYFIAFVGPLTTKSGGLICGGDIPQSDPDCPESDWSHGPVERIHHSDESVVELMIPFFTPQGRASFARKWNTQSTEKIQLECDSEQTGMDFPVFLGPVSAKPEVEGEEVLQSLLGEVQSSRSDIIPRHKSAKRIRAHPEEPKCEWLAVPFLNVEDCKFFGSAWNRWGREYHKDVVCYCYTSGHKLGLSYEFE